MTGARRGSCRFPPAAFDGFPRAGNTKICPLISG